MQQKALQLLQLLSDQSNYRICPSLAVQVEGCDVVSHTAQPCVQLAAPVVV